MEITTATAADVDEAVACLASAFAEDPITGFLLEFGPGYRERVTQFFSLLMTARLELGMPVLLARDQGRIQGAVMGYATEPPEWPAGLAEAWDRFEASIAGLSGRLAVYDGVADKYRPAAPHYYLGVIGVDPGVRGQGIGRQLLQAFCALSAVDGRSCGVYLETAKPSNLPFYERAGFKECGRGALGADTLWCMYAHHATSRP